MEEIFCKSCGEKLKPEDLERQKDVKGTFYCLVKYEQKPVGYTCGNCGFKGKFNKSKEKYSGGT